MPACGHASLLLLSITSLKDLSMETTMVRHHTSEAISGSVTASPTARSMQMLTVGALAKRSGIAVSTIRFYENKGLIRSDRTSGNQRRYPRSILRRVSVIRVAQRAGLSLSEIKTYMDTLPEGRVTEEEWRRLSKSWRGLLDGRIASLVQLRDHLADCIGCGCLSLKNCPLRNPADALSREGPGPRLIMVEKS